MNVVSLSALSLAVYAPHVVAQELSELSLEDLLAVEVSSVAKKRQKANEAPAAVYVITQEDIRQSGETTVPNLLRLAPGVEVAQLDGNVTAVTIRGFNSRFSNKLLVLVDGRAIYSPSFSGVMWDQIPIAVEEIERIEIVRGPGATIWGANAVNGVINIITKHGVDTLGGAASARADTEGGATLYGRFGGQLGESSTFRLYAKGLKNPGLNDANGKAFNDGWKSGSIGFRFDAEPNDNDAFTFQGDAQIGDFQSTLLLGLNPVSSTSDEEFNNYNVLGRWTRRQDHNNEFTLQAYIDNAERSEFGVNLSRTVYDLDFSYTAKLFDRHSIVWGLGYRHSTDEFLSSPLIAVSPTREAEAVISGFIQDEVRFFDDKLAITAGIKLEHNDYTGFENQPSLRAIWNDPDGWAVWGAVSRAVRTPSRYERDATVSFQEYAPMSERNPSPLPLTVSVLGSRDLEAEVLTAYEVGLRKAVSKNISFDVTAFYNDYDKANSYAPQPTFVLGGPFPIPLEMAMAMLAGGGGAPPFPLSIFAPVKQSNDATLKAVGIEASMKAVLSDRWRLDVIASSLDLQAEAQSTPGAFSTTASVSDPALSPQWQAAVRSNYELTDKIELYGSMRHVAELPAAPGSDYTDVDLKITWRPGANMEIYLKGDNLLDKRHKEFIWRDYPTSPGYVEQKIDIGLAVRF